MADKNEMISANRVYGSLLNIVRKNKYDFDDDEEIMTVNFDVKREENNRFEACVNICKCSCELDMGSFDYDLYSGSIEFRMATSFNGSLISDKQIENMISYTCGVVKKYTDRLCS